MQKMIFQVFKTPYPYILLGTLLIIILCILFYKRIKSLLKVINIHAEKKSTFTLGHTTSTQSSKDKIGIKAENIEMENSKAGEIEGNVAMKNVKIKNSTIGSIRGR